MAFFWHFLAKIGFFCKVSSLKSPILPDEASRGKLEEKTSSKFSERYRDYINLGVTVWHQDHEKHA